MIIKRNVYFSAVDEETGEERLFSTTELIDEEDYQKLYSEKKLKFSDRTAIQGYKGKRQEYRDEAREMYTTGKSGKNIKTERALMLAGISAGQSLGKSLSTPGITPKQAAAGAAISAAGGAVDSAIGGYVLDKYHQHKLKKNPKAYEKKIDRINVAEGKMSEEEFAKKYYKK